MSTLSPSGRVSRPRMSSSQSFESCGEINTLWISTPVLFTRVKSCAAASWLAVEDDVFAAVLGAGVAADAAGLAIFALVFVFVGVEQAIARSSANVIVPIANKLFM